MAGDTSLEVAGHVAPGHRSGTSGDAPGTSCGDPVEKPRPEGGGAASEPPVPGAAEDALWVAQPGLGLVHGPCSPGSRVPDPGAGRASASCHTRSLTLTPTLPAGRHHVPTVLMRKLLPGSSCRRQKRGHGSVPAPQGSPCALAPRFFLLHPECDARSQASFLRRPRGRKVAGGWAGPNL